jgi:hypothetical protein
MKYILLIIFLIVVVILVLNNNNNNKENFNNQSGQYCYDCEGKTPNQCDQCFNCGFCLDEFGNGACIGGDMNGPYNRQKCVGWYNIDPLNQLNEDNENYKCSYGPKSSNRVYGINPNTSDKCKSCNSC